MELPHEVWDVRLIAVVEVARRSHGQFPLSDLNALLEGPLPPLRGLEPKSLMPNMTIIIRCWWRKREMRNTI